MTHVRAAAHLVRRCVIPGWALNPRASLGALMRPDWPLPTVTGFAARQAIAALRKHNIATAPLLRRAGLSE